MGRGERMKPQTTVEARSRVIRRTCDDLIETTLEGKEATLLRRERLGQLAEDTVDSYRQRWQEKMLPFVNQLGLSGATVEDALGEAPKRWPGGYRGCALNLAKENLNWAIDRDAAQLAAGKREQSKLTNSWVAENIAISWRDTYLSALLDRLNQEPGLRRQNLDNEDEVEWSHLCRGWRLFNKEKELSAAAALRQTAESSS